MSSKKDKNKSKEEKVKGGGSGDPIPEQPAGPVIGPIETPEAIGLQTPEPELSETPVIDGKQADAPVEVLASLTPEAILADAKEELLLARDAIKRNLEALDKIEESILIGVREQVDLPQDIQLSALCGISSGTVIKVDKANLDCVLLGQAKGYFVKHEDGEIHLRIDKRIRVVDKKEK